MVQDVTKERKFFWTRWSRGYFNTFQQTRKCQKLEAILKVKISVFVNEDYISQMKQPVLQRHLTEMTMLLELFRSE